MWRLRLLGLGTMLGQPLFGWIWISIYPQPYESIWMRCLLAVLAGVLILPAVNKNLSSIKTQAFFSIIAWIEFPFFFSWMYVQNSGSPVWVASVCSMILIYYHLTDWRIATAGILTGAMTAWAAYYRFADPGFPDNVEHATNAVVIAFSWGCALLLGLSSADLRREHLSSTLATIGIMAHELRTPLSTAALLGDAIQIEVRRYPDNAGAPQIEKLAMKLHALVRNMNHQIDTQIANAKLRNLPCHVELVLAGKLVSDVVANYPYVASRQRLCIRVQIHNDFAFRSSSQQFSQVLDNLIKNAF